MASESQSKRPKYRDVPLRCLCCKRNFKGQYSNKQGKLTSSGLSQHLRSTAKPGFKKDPCFAMAYRNEVCKSVDEIDFKDSRVFQANHHANPLGAGDSVSDITSPTDIMPGFKPDGGSEEDTAAMEEEKNETEKKKGSFGMLWEPLCWLIFRSLCQRLFLPIILLQKASLATNKSTARHAHLNFHLKYLRKG
ncbi:unnamed protein product [Cylindrotheca closterium]|uniref:Uncharacterized protein n=1 Tax=Cylindrotheca closterium TaxID=2856 RepID=A0AAD2CUS9_9STRA|nr:unnamed protein product [Cylindrotheca closterium]